MQWCLALASERTPFINQSNFTLDVFLFTSTTKWTLLFEPNYQKFNFTLLPVFLWETIIRPGAGQKLFSLGNRQTG